MQEKCRVKQTLPLFSFTGTSIFCVIKVLLALGNSMFALLIEGCWLLWKQCFPLELMMNNEIPALVTCCVPKRWHMFLVWTTHKRPRTISCLYLPTHERCLGKKRLHKCHLVTVTSEILRWQLFLFIAAWKYNFWKCLSFTEYGVIFCRRQYVVTAIQKAAQPSKHEKLIWLEWSLMFEGFSSFCIKMWVHIKVCPINISLLPVCWGPTAHLCTFSLHSLALPSFILP